MNNAYIMCYYMRISVYVCVIQLLRLIRYRERLKITPPKAYLKQTVDVRLSYR